jgi:hypothetical protein
MQNRSTDIGYSNASPAATEANDGRVNATSARREPWLERRQIFVGFLAKVVLSTTIAALIGAAGAMTISIIATPSPRRRRRTPAQPASKSAALQPQEYPHRGHREQ